MPRVISMIASATEIVCALGYQSSLVGRSHECDFPEEVASLPQVTEPRIITEGSSLEIDIRIRESLASAVSIYNISTDLIKELKPDIIITQTVCEICAVSLNDVRKALEEIAEHDIEIVPLSPISLEDIWNDIRRVGEALGDGQQGRLLAIQLQKRMATIAERVEKIETRPTVATIEWIEPLMAGGNWMPDLVAMAGGNNLFGVSGKHSPEMSFNSLIKANPEIILVTPCGWGIDKTREEIKHLESQNGWNDLQAVKGNRVYLADGNQYFNRPGPRLVESLEILAEIIHPEHFNFNHAGTGWERYRS